MQNIGNLTTNTWFSLQGVKLMFGIILGNFMWLDVHQFEISFFFFFF